MKSRRLKEACKKMQAGKKDGCVCQTGLMMNYVIEPCIKPCDPLLEHFLNGLVG